MADFCKQCSIEQFGEDLHDLAGLIMDSTGTSLALCEGCGFIAVDTEGQCVDPMCETHGTTSIKDHPDVKRRMTIHLGFKHHLLDVTPLGHRYRCYVCSCGAAINPP